MSAWLWLPIWFAVWALWRVLKPTLKYLLWERPTAEGES